MFKLANGILTDPNSINPRFSFGPFVSCNGSDFYFDVSHRNLPLWLGHFASPVFGLMQFEETWSLAGTADFKRLVAAAEKLKKRARSRLPGKLKLLANHNENTSAVQKIYDYVTLSILDQYPETYFAIVKSINTKFKELVDKHRSLVVKPIIDAENFRFGFDHHAPLNSERFNQRLNQLGIYRCPDGNEKKPILFELNLAFRNEKLDLFWERLNLAFALYADSKTEILSATLQPWPEQSSTIEFFEVLRNSKMLGKCPDHFQPLDYLSAQLRAISKEITVHQVTPENYSEFRARILDMQSLVYEPMRQTPPEEFDMLFESENPLAIVACESGTVAAMVFAGQLGLFRNEHGGIGTDPFIDDPTVYYSVDLTVAPKFRGGAGKLMKQALVLLAIDNGVTAIHGRNRDRLAAGMWAINLSLGSYELQHLADDYQDDEAFRDCIYYRCPLRWSSEATHQIPIENAGMLDSLGL